MVGRGRSTMLVAIALVVLSPLVPVTWGAEATARAKADPCRGLRGVSLPVDDADALERVQRRIVKCAAHLHETGFGLEEKAQCVPFAYALMDRLRSPEMRYSSGGDTAGAYFARLESLGQTSIPARTGRPKKEKRPLFVWWQDGLDEGHVGVYIGGDLFVDSQSAFLMAKHDLSPKDPAAVAWNLRKPTEQATLMRYVNRPWPRRSPAGPDGYSSARVNGGSCRVCEQ